MEKFGPILAIAVIAILLIVITSIFPLTPEQQRGFIFIGVALLLFLVAGITFTLHWIVGLVIGIIGIILLSIGVNSLLSSTHTTSAGLLLISNVFLPS